ncbi:MAG TPA: hypothetical protein VD704_10225 [Gaiellaceae bacterium]|nr:hypothetical protein [Gaiellaceae bacterium]
MERWTRATIRWRWAVVGAWAVLVLVSLAAIAGLSDLLTNRFSLPGTETARAERILEEQFGQRTTGAFTIVVRGEPGSAPALVAPVEAAAVRASEALPTSEISSTGASPTPS